MRNEWAVLALLAFMLAGCQTQAEKRAATVTGGDPQRGAYYIGRYGCGSCHTIPGISGAHGKVGPSLDGVGGRMYVAGNLPNEPENLAHWVQDPHSVNEKTAMPNVGVSPHDANDIAAYLYSLR